MSASIQGVASCIAFLLLLSSCGRVVAIKLPGRDPNPNGYYVCEPAGDASFECRSHRELHQYDRELDAGKECSFGVADVYVQTNWHGGVSRIQYVCSTPAVGGFPSVPNPPGPAPDARPPTPPSP